MRQRAIPTIPTGDDLLPEYLRPKGGNVSRAEVARRRRRERTRRATHRLQRGTR